MADHHTPGPWSVEMISDSGGGTRLQIAASAAKFGRVAVLSRLDESMANARLIAAAPDLLEALQEARAVVAESVEAHGDDDDPPEDAWDVVALRAIDEAIAKATGQEARDG